MESLVEYRNRDTVDGIAHEATTGVSTIGVAIRACRSGRLTQDQLAEKASFGQSTLSQWENDKSVPDANQLRTIEDACGRPHGWILIQAGYVADHTSVPDAIDMAPELNDNARRVLKDIYAGLLKK